MAGDRPDSRREMVTRVVSKIGTSSTNTGPAMADTTSARLPRTPSGLSVMAARVNPSIRLPLSPMKIDAGGKL